MRAFIDTSALVKKYVREIGSDEFSVFLDGVREIVVAPTYRIELASAIQRKRRLREITPKQASWLMQEAKKDLNFFSSVRWSEELGEEACRLIYDHNITSLDAIQLSSAVLAKPDVFVSSDKDLCLFAKKELKTVQHIG